MTRKEQIAWAAGFLDGEGSFFYEQKTPVVSCGQRQPWPLERLAEIFGMGNVRGPYFRGNGTDLRFYIWKLHGAKALVVMEQVKDLVSPRRQEQIENTISQCGPITLRRFDRLSREGTLRDDEARRDGRRK